MAETFTDSNGMEWPLCYAICKCHIYLSVWDGRVGHCGRCYSKCRNLMPMISKREAVQIFVDENGHLPDLFLDEASYNPEFGDDRICQCGHPYYRHFDTYEDMYPAGCKYCMCPRFREPK